MAIYALGDLQGCVSPLEEMLDILRFDPAQDQLWLAGDLVNRGPDSLATLRLIKSLGDSAIAILGNHDLHLLAVADGAAQARDGDTIEPILQCHDREELLRWLRHRPLAHCDADLKIMMVHAGVYPGWRRKSAAHYAAEIAQLLRGAHYPRFLRRMYGRHPNRWSADLEKWPRARFITNVFTRMRYCAQTAAAPRLDFDCSLAPGEQPPGLVPWFAHPAMKFKRWRIVFGHWSSLGFMRRKNVIGLDSGCVWGGALTAICLHGEQPGKIWRLPCKKQP